VEGHSQAGLVFALALGAGMVAQLLARHARVPSIVFLLGAGVLLGPDGLGLVRPRELGDGLMAIVQLAVAVILFEGGLNLELDRLRRAGRAIQLLVTLGAFITACGAGLAAYWIMEWPWRQALLFGTLVIVTGPTVIRPILRNVPLRGRLATLLEAEGVLIDPVGAIVAAVALEVVLVPAALEVGFGAPALVARLLFGTLVGLAGGWLLGQLLRRPRGSRTWSPWAVRWSSTPGATPTCRRAESWPSPSRGWWLGTWGRTPRASCASSRSV
jgi:NhaP-type Na+/H+ or K+/H+ antiporter